MSGYERMREVLAESNELATVFGAETRFGRAVAAIRQVFADIRATSDADSGEPVEQVLGNDGIWRWAHTARGIVRDHVAKPVG